MRLPKFMLALPVVMLLAAAALAQDPAAPPAGGAAPGATAPAGGGRGPGGGRMTPEEMAKRMQDRIKDQIGATAEEWQVIQPRLQTVMEKEAAARGMTARGGMWGGGRGGRAGGAGAPGGAPATAGQGGPAAAPEVDAVTKAIESKDPAAIKTALDALRAARAAKTDEANKAKAALREVLSVSQEAQLVLMGMLD